jgi:hypothetical protein
VGGGFFLTPNGDLYYGNNVVATGVATATDAVEGNISYGEYTLLNGSGGYQLAGSSNGTAPINNTWSKVPAGSVSVGGGYFLSPTGDLYYGDNVVASGVASAKGSVEGTGSYGEYTLKSGSGAYQVLGFNNGTWQANNTWSAVPPGSTPVGGGYFLTPSGTLYYGNTVVASGVTSATGVVMGTTSYGNYVIPPC